METIGEEAVRTLHIFESGMTGITREQFTAPLSWIKPLLLKDTDASRPSAHTG
jgi:hypothetical protein